MAKVILIEETDGIYPNGECYHTKHESILTEEPTTRNIIDALRKKLNRFEGIHTKLSQAEINDWIKNDKSIITFAEKDYSQRTVRWRIKYEE